MSYTLKDHKHRFAAWAASRAASAKGQRFKVELGLVILTDASVHALVDAPDDLPDPSDTDLVHRKWREEILLQAAKQGQTWTHGVAAKLINIYLKAGLICGGYAHHAKVAALHPPVDRVLLKTLEKEDVGGHRAFWRKFGQRPWSKFDSDTYEDVIRKMREVMGTEPLWMIEQHWRGFQ